MRLRILKGTVADALRYGSDDGLGYGDSYGYGSGDGSGDGNGYGYGYGDGSGYGYYYGDPVKTGLEKETHVNKDNLGNSTS